MGRVRGAEAVLSTAPVPGTQPTPRQPSTHMRWSSTLKPAVRAKWAMTSSGICGRRAAGAVGAGRLARVGRRAPPAGACGHQPCHIHPSITRRWLEILQGRQKVGQVVGQGGHGWAEQSLTHGAARARAPGGLRRWLGVGRSAGTAPCRRWGRRGSRRVQWHSAPQATPAGRARPRPAPHTRHVTWAALRCQRRPPRPPLQVASCASWRSTGERDVHSRRGGLDGAGAAGQPLVPFWGQMGRWREKEGWGSGVCRVDGRR